MSHLFAIDQTMAAAPERVFEALVAIDRWPEWLPGLVQIDKLTDLPFGPGFRWRETRRLFGRKAVEEFEVVALEPHHAMVLTCDGRKGTTGRGQFRYRYDLIPKGGLTQVSLMCEVDGLGRWGDAMFWMFGGTFKKAIAADVSALRRYVERIKMP